MIQHRWFKIEQGADGTILSCVEVEAKGVKCGTVRFYSAVDASAACYAAKKWYKAHRIKHNSWQRDHREKIKGNGECVTRFSGCTKVVEPGKSRCANCKAKALAGETARRARHKVGDMTDLRLHPGGPAQVMQNQRAAANAGTRKLREAAGGARAYEALLMLRKFDSLGPVAFRAWLVSKIPSMQQTQGEWHPPMVVDEATPNWSWQQAAE